MQNLQTPIRIGDRVRVRRQRWRVVEVRSHEACELLTLIGLGPLNGGKERRILTPFDLVESLAPAERLRIVGLPRWRRRCRDWLGENRAAGDLQTARPARIDLLPHQLEPALALVRGRGSRVLIADAVGLGKTIQAGLIVAELRARGAADRVLILTPAGLRDQWATELSDRFDLGFTIVDMGETRRRATELPIGLNPWSTMPSVIASIDYVKRPEVVPALAACRWDVVVVDEAHAATRGSERYHAVSSLCQRAPFVVLLTATPHNGDRAAFESLCALGSLEHDRLLVFRRDRHEVALGAGRCVHRVAVASTREELHMHQLLARFTHAVRTERGDDRAAWLALATLHKRALSSARSLEETVERRLAGLPTSAGESFQQMSLPLADAWGELDSSDEAPLWASPALDDVDRERRMLGRLAAAARAAASSESKLGRLVRLLRRLARYGEPAIVFTEYRDTLAHVQQKLPAQCAVLHGGLTRDERRTALEDFQRGRRTILLATDAGSEGLNLHQGCRVVINLELPWNPMRLEQRIGRVDRIGQLRRVHAFNLIARDTGEMQLFERLKVRIARARQDIGAADPLDTMREDDEQAAARLVIAAESHGGAGAATSGGDDGGPRAFVRFTIEADAERSRLLDARRVASATPRSERVDLDAETWIALARRPITRMRLASHVLVLLQSLVEDGCGRMVSFHVTPLVVRTNVPIGRHEVRRAIAAIRLELRRHALTDAGEAHCDVDRLVHLDFWNTRLTRERAIAAARTQAEAAAGVFQPGLFDRRAERQHETLDAANHDARQYIDAAIRAAVVEVRPYRAALFLIS
jgi:superfamily II DNA or RNA helicase